MSTRLERRYDIDWLRFLAICAVFLFHCARFFDDGGWHVKNAQANVGIMVFVSVIAQWVMPIFFIISGISTHYSLGAKQQNGLYLWERFKRLMIPLIFAIFTMIPLQVYYERVSHLQFIPGTFLIFTRIILPPNYYT